MRFLPSFVFFVVLSIFAILEDRSNRQSLEEQRRESAKFILDDVQRQFDRFVTDGVRASRRLASGIALVDDISQDTFGSTVQSMTPESLRLIRAQYAPEFVTQFVYPMEANESFIGQSPVSAGGDASPDLSAEVARGFPVLRRLEVDTDGRGELEVQAELRRTLDRSIISEGVVNLAASFQIEISNGAPALAADEVDFLVLSHPVGEPLPDIPEEWRAEGNHAPFQQVMHYPPGDFQLFIRPSNGWAPDSHEVKVFRSRLALLAVAVLIPVFLANWLAVSRVLTRAKLAQTQEQMSGLIQNLPGAALSIHMPPGAESPSVKDKVQFLNPHSSEEIWGLPSEVLERDGKQIWNVVATQDAAEELKTNISLAVRDLQSFNTLWPIRTPNGETKWLHGSGAPSRQPEGATMLSMLIIDNTQQVERQKELELQRDLLFRAQKTESIGQLTGGVAHDFNNILAVILGNLELIDETENPQEIEEFLDAAKSATHRGADLTMSLLSFARQSRLEPKIVDINQVVKETKNWSSRVLPANITVELSLADGLWPVETDPSMTQNALLNLILNSRDALPIGGKIEIKTTNAVVDETNESLGAVRLEPGRYVVLAVTDNGEGIPIENMSQIFDPFFTTKAVGGGSGLGLSMVQGFAEQSGGGVSVSSEVGVGTTFKLYFKALIGTNEAAPREEPVSKQFQETDARVLIVEDEIAVLEVLRNILKAAGYHITSARSGDDALRMWDEEARFDLLVTDIAMPGELQGFQLAHELRQRQGELPVVFISGYASEVTFHQRAGHLDDILLMKPVKRSELLAAVEKALMKDT